MKRYVFLTNIPSPYRTSFYDRLHEFGLKFEVFYMRSSEADRNWPVDPATLRHPFYIDKSFYKMIGLYHLHINPKIILRMIRRTDAEFIIGGAWNDVDVLILVLLKRLGVIDNVFHFWTEANYLTIGSQRDNHVKRWLRKFVYNSSQGCQISSGKMTRLTFEKWGMPGKRFIDLPNTIVETQFAIGREEIEARVGNRLPVFFLPARLIESVKGILNFLSAVGDENLRRCVILVAGEGPDRAKIESYVETHSLRNSVELLGHRDTEGVVELYRKANVFLLPSFSDPCPLTVVEALCMHLPMLISNRCGNHYEAVEEGVNGYLFDPSDADSIRLAFESMLSRKAEWREMGEMSGRRYLDFFEEDRVIRRFIRELEDFECGAAQRAGTALWR
jgi:glycosyltransferase involved in cell wall biosynthesis